MQQIKYQRGFTLVEVVAAVIILGLLVSSWATAAGGEQLRVRRQQLSALCNIVVMDLTAMQVQAYCQTRARQIPRMDLWQQGTGYHLICGDKIIKQVALGKLGLEQYGLYASARAIKFLPGGAPAATSTIRVVHREDASLQKYICSQPVTGRVIIQDGT